MIKNMNIGILRTKKTVYHIPIKNLKKITPYAWSWTFYEYISNWIAQSPFLDKTGISNFINVVP